MFHLALCTACARHVRSDESSCPFCDAAIEPSPPPALPKRRLNRAATFAFGAALAGATACGGTHTGDDAGPQVDSGVDAGAIAQPYGLPPVDAGPLPDAGSLPDAGVDSGPIAQPYGAPAYGAAPGD